MAATNNSSNSHTVTQNGDKLQLSNTLCLSGCLKAVEVTLPTITGADVYFTGTPSIGTYAAGVWTVGDWCEADDPEITFTWCVEVTDIEVIDGTYTGIATTTTTQDPVDDSFEITITKACPDIGTDGPSTDCETVETVVCYQPTPEAKPKKQIQKIQVRTSKRMGTVKKKVAALEKGEKCGLDNLKVG